MLNTTNTQEIQKNTELPQRKNAIIVHGKLILSSVLQKFGLHEDVEIQKAVYEALTTSHQNICNESDGHDISYAKPSDITQHHDVYGMFVLEEKEEREAVSLKLNNLYTKLVDAIEEDANWDSMRIMYNEILQALRELPETNKVLAKSLNDLGIETSAPSNRLFFVLAGKYITGTSLPKLSLSEFKEIINLRKIELYGTEGRLAVQETRRVKTGTVEGEVTGEEAEEGIKDGSDEDKLRAKKLTIVTPLRGDQRNPERFPTHKGIQTSDALTLLKNEKYTVVDLDPTDESSRIVFPAEGNFPLQTGVYEQQESGEEVVFDKIKELVSLFDELKIEKKDITSYVGSIVKTGESSSRKESFFCFVLRGSYNKTIYISPEVKTTYIIHDVASIKNLEPFVSKGGLEDTKKTTRILAPQDESAIAAWKKEVKAAILKEKEKEKENNIVVPSSLDKNFEGEKDSGIIKPRDKAYYEDKENIQYDLKEFAKAAGKKTVQALSTSDSAEIVCKNGDFVNLQKYLKNAGVELGLVSNSTEASSKQLEILTKLKEIGMFLMRDKAYYEDKENIRYDLEAFAKAAGKETVQELSTKDSSEIVCKNGESVKWGTYLLNAGVKLGLVSNDKEASSKQSEILTKLKDIGEYIMRNKTYYEAKENIQYDLKEFAKAAGKESVQELSTNDVGEIVCKNGELVKWKRYLLNAGVKLGLATNKREAGGKISEILDKLKEIGEYIMRNKEYYETKENIQYDLEAFAKAAGKETVQELSTSGSFDVVCKNGELVKWDTYLLNAGVELGLASNAKESSGKKLEILTKLKEIGEYIMRDKAYYEDKENIQYDLKAFAKVAGKKTVQELFTSDSGEIVCKNGEFVNLQKYLKNAGVKLGLASNDKEAGCKLSEILKKLKEIGGYT